MNPAFSVILFTTLSGAGYGLLFWWGLALYSTGLVDADHGTLFAWAIAFTAGLVLVSIGLSSSVFHLGKPQRAWRAFSQWRTSWLSREGVVSILTYVAAAAFLASAKLEWAISMDASAALIAAGSLSTVYCTAMIYASLKPIPAWRHALVVPGYFIFALLTGGLLCLGIFATAAYEFSSAILLIIIALIAAAAAMIKLVYWRDIDRIELPSRESATALRGIGTVTVFERPHTEANYLTREMGFVLARKHSRKLRMIALLLFAVIPLLAICAAWLLPGSIAAIALWIAAISAIAGAFVERWLFFAEAKHMVMLYY